MDEKPYFPRLAPHMLRILALGGLLALGACAAQPGQPARQRAEPDPLTLGHSQWCGTNPPSGYCGLDDNR